MILYWVNKTNEFQTIFFIKYDTYFPDPVYQVKVQ